MGRTTMHLAALFVASWLTVGAAMQARAALPTAKDVQASPDASYIIAQLAAVVQGKGYVLVEEVQKKRRLRLPVERLLVPDECRKGEHAQVMYPSFQLTSVRGKWALTSGKADTTMVLFAPLAPGAYKLLEMKEEGDGASFAWQPLVLLNAEKDATEALLRDLDDRQAAAKLRAMIQPDTVGATVRAMAEFSVERGTVVYLGSFGVVTPTIDFSKTAMGDFNPATGAVTYVLRDKPGFVGSLVDDAPYLFQALVAEDPDLAEVAANRLVKASYLGGPDGEQVRQQVARVLLTGADVNAKDKYGQTPLHRAVGAGAKDVAEVLLAKGADANAKDNDGWTPLHRAAGAASKDVAQVLLAKGADVNAKSNDGATPLHVAAWTASVNPRTASKDVAEVLLAKGADVNAKTSEGETPLHEAAWAGSKDLAELFLRKGADVNAKDNLGRTPLTIAQDQGRKAVAELLRKHGATK